MRRLGSLFAVILALTALAAAPAASDGPVAATGTFEVLRPYNFNYSSGLALVTGPPFPVDAFLREEDPRLGYFDVVRPPWSPDRDAGWVYANERGRVRVLADTTNFHTPFGFGSTQAEYERWVATLLYWEKTYVKKRGDTATFTVNRSELGVFHPEWYEPPPPTDVPPTPPFLPYVKLSLLIKLYRPQLPADAPGRVRDEFWAEIELVRDADVFSNCGSASCPPLGDHAYGCVNEISEPRHNIWRCEQGLDRGNWFSVQDSPLYAYPVDFARSYVLIETRPYPGTIDLSDIGEGEQYVLEYVLTADAVSYGNIENWTRAQLGDPLDAESGLGLEVSSLEAPAGTLPRRCDVAPDAMRFAVQADGTVTDGATGLMWQRCPTGFSLDSAGTPGDLSDDRCLASSAALPTWQGALQGAAADTTAGHLDWRLPNVKELESIVELGCHMPAIEPAPFPDTPSEPFWTSTPAREANAAMMVSFVAGAIGSADKSSSAYLRLVRDGSVPAVASLPVVRIGHPDPVLEGQGGTAMVFTIALDRAAGSEVSMRYRTMDDDARAGRDYVDTSGTLVIPAGARVAHVAVPILGDAEGEQAESLYLVLDQVSANARIAVAVGSGSILDSQPRIDVAHTNVAEGDSGSVDLVFLLTLSEPSTLDAAVAYETADGTASSSDYAPDSGTVTIPAGRTSAVVRVAVTGDTVVEGDEWLLLTLSDPTPNVVLGTNASARGYIVEDDLPFARALNDTGIGQCTNGGIFLGCPQAGWPGQDAETGRDVTDAEPTDGHRGFSFTKLDAAGAPLADQTQPYTTAPWSCVRDEVTALVWEIKTDDGGLHDKDWTYTWYNSSGIDDGGDPGTPTGGTCAGSGCDTERFVSAVNVAGLCGATDWRLPTREELRSLIVAKDGGFIYVGDPPWLPNTPGSHWTSTPSIDPGEARYFVQATATEGAKSSPRPARLVRGGVQVED